MYCKVLTFCLVIKLVVVIVIVVIVVVLNVYNLLLGIYFRPKDFSCFYTCIQTIAVTPLC